MTIRAPHFTKRVAREVQQPHPVTNLLVTTLAVAGIPFLPIDQVAPHSLPVQEPFQQISFIPLITAAGDPFAHHDWPNPQIEPIQEPVQLRTQLPEIVDPGTPVSPPQFDNPDFPIAQEPYNIGTFLPLTVVAQYRFLEYELSRPEFPIAQQPNYIGNSLPVGIPDSTASVLIVGSATETQVVTGGQVWLANLSTETYVPAGTGPIGSIAVSQAIIDGLVSAQSETNGWNVERSNIAVTDLARTSDVVATLTLPPLPSYEISLSETLTWTVPGSALTGGSALIGSPTITITADVPISTNPVKSVAFNSDSASVIFSSGADFISKLSKEDGFVILKEDGFAILVRSGATTSKPTIEFSSTSQFILIKEEE